MPKNDTRLASLMGTWTVDSRIKSNFGLYEMDLNFIIYLMGDPLRENSCDLPGCAEVNNSFCIYEDDSSSPNLVKRCKNMADSVSSWSDAVAFIYFDIEFRLGIPFDINEKRSTGGWIGPLNMILARNFSATEEEETANSNVIDRYVARYVQTPISPYIMMSPNMTLLSKEDFPGYFGLVAINNTAHVQAEPVAVNGDIYAPFLNTCDNGNIHPILPLYQFEFVRDPQTGNETINVKLDYKILTIPDEHTRAWKWMPTLAKRGLPVKGPYCYANTLRGWIIDLPFDSTVGSKYINLQHGCVEGLPCLPLAGQLLKPTVKVEVHELPGSTTVTVDFRSVAYLSSVLAVFVIAFLASLLVNYRLRKHLIILSSSAQKSRWPSSASEEQSCTNGLHDSYYCANTMEEELLVPLSAEAEHMNNNSDLLAELPKRKS